MNPRQEGSRELRPPDRSKIGYRPALDGLRGVSILAVIAYHFSNQQRPIAGGWLGVELFFLISGFLITRLALEEYSATRRLDLRSFYVRRVSRLVPVLVAVIAASLYWGRATGAPKGRMVLSASAALLYGENWLMSLRGELATWVFSHTWSLAIEEQFYLLWPIVLTVLAGVVAIRLAKRLVLVMAVVFFAGAGVQAALGVGQNWYYSGSFGQAPGFLLVGCWLAMVLPIDVNTRSSVIGRHLDLAALVSTMAILPLLLWVDNGERWLYWGPLALVCLGLVVVVIAALQADSRVAALASSRPLVFIGRLSYSIYVWHALVVFEVSRWIVQRSYKIDWAERISIMSVLTLAISTTSFFCLERPARRWLNARFSRASLAETASPG